jgi:hypothetical protein
MAREEQQSENEQGKTAKKEKKQQNQKREKMQKLGEDVEAAFSGGVKKYKDEFDKILEAAEKGAATGGTKRYNDGGPVKKCKVDGIATQGFTKAYSLKKGK